MNTTLFNIFALCLCLLLSFLLSGMEAGVFALNRLRVRRLARTGQRSAQMLHNFLENPEKFLWTIVVGNTLANFVVLGWAWVKIHEYFFEHRAWMIGLFVLTAFLFYTFCDLLPKMLFRAHPNSLCLSTARVFGLVYFTLRPLVLIVEEVSQTVLRWTGGRAFTGRLFGNREEMRAVMQESAQNFSSDERAMINRVLDLQNFTVGQIATPVAQVVSVKMETPIAEALALAREKRFSRLPVWENREGRPRIAGLLLLGRLLFNPALDVQGPASAHMTPALFLGEDTRLEIALRRMQRAGERLIVVLARDGSELGLVSLEDILKVMFGEVKL